MSALIVVLLELLCCLGLGAATLRVLRIDADMTPGERWAISFAVGLGVLGWLIFPLGVAGFLSQGPLTATLTAGALATVLLRKPGTFPAVPRFDVVGRLLLALLGMVLIFDLMEGVAPPADGDTLAYHFTIAKRFLEAGRIEFIPRPLEGAIPLLVQMTYVPALGLGGEMALTLWTMATGWAAAALLFVLCRQHLGVNWSLAVTLIFLTTPAVIYGGGSGQVETRMSLFVMVAAWAAVRALETGRANYTVLAGIGGGFYMAAKYLGLLFVGAAGVVLLFQRRWLMHGAVFAAAVLAAGFQWYAWNALYTGDPVFPVLFQWLGRADLAFWDQARNLVFRELLDVVEGRGPHTPLWLVLYPFGATLGFGNLLDAGRVGWGPYGLLIMPFAVFGLWRYRDRVRHSPLLVYAALAVLFYVEWFFLSGTQRIRHLVPVLPLFLICVTVAAERFVADGRYRGPLLAAVAATLFLQAGVHGLFARNYAKYLVQGADREAFLARNVFGYPVVLWINANLTKADRIYVNQRQIRYYLEVPDFFGSYFMQSVIELRPDKTDARTLHRQLRAAGVTHLLLVRGATGTVGVYQAPFDLLREAGCLAPLKRIETQKFRSRTMPRLLAAPQTMDVLKLRDERCLD